MKTVAPHAYRRSTVIDNNIELSPQKKVLPYDALEGRPNFERNKKPSLYSTRPTNALFPQNGVRGGTGVDEKYNYLLEA